jgi:hypothetical protein
MIEYLGRLILCTEFFSRQETCFVLMWAMTFSEKYAASERFLSVTILLMFTRMYSAVIQLTTSHENTLCRFSQDSLYWVPSRFYLKFFFIVLLCFFTIYIVTEY